MGPYQGTEVSFKEPMANTPTGVPLSSAQWNPKDSLHVQGLPKGNSTVASKQCFSLLLLKEKLLFSSVSLTEMLQAHLRCHK